MKKEKRDTHYFNPQIAKHFGLNAAVVFHNIEYWVTANREQKRKDNFKNGMYWTYNTVKTYSDTMFYLTENQIRTALDLLRQDGILYKNCFNKNAHDRTAWYSVNYKRYNEILGKNLCDSSQMDLGCNPNGNEPQPKCLITDIETNEKSNKENTCSLSKKISKTSENQISNTVKENEILLKPPVPAAPFLEKQTNFETDLKSTNKNVVPNPKQTEAELESTNVSKVECIYTKNIESVISVFNGLSSQNLSANTKAYQNLITKCLKTFSKKELKDGSALEAITRMLELKKSHTKTDSKIFFQEQYFRISTLFAKANFSKYLIELEESEAVKVVAKKDSIQKSESNHKNIFR
jgi:hypothetical protein